MSDVAEDTEEKIFDRIRRLNEHLWDGRVRDRRVKLWLNNFEDAERLDALYLLSQFLYLGRREILEILHSMHRDLLPTVLVDNAEWPEDPAEAAQLLQVRMGQTRFLGLGNPSESGPHILYHYRQANRLDAEAFLDAYRILAGPLDVGPTGLTFPDVRDYIVLDDLCGSGESAEDFGIEVVAAVKRYAATLGVELRFHYLCMFATEQGLDAVRLCDPYDSADSIHVLDDSFKSVDPASRYFAHTPDGVSLAAARALVDTHGTSLWPPNPRGWGDGQLLIGFAHNTPDNSLPIMWFDEDPERWHAVFPRFPKLV